MTKLSSKATALAAVGFLGGALALSCVTAAAAQRSSANDLSYVVRFQLGTTYVETGDRITIEEVRGTSAALTAGSLYEVKGTYNLVSQDRALLGAFVTTGSVGPTRNMQTQKMTVAKGSGRFSLFFYMWDNGSPHVSFYPVPSADSFAGVYSVQVSRFSKMHEPA